MLKQVKNTKECKQMQHILEKPNCSFSITILFDVPNKMFNLSLHIVLHCRYRCVIILIKNKNLERLWSKIIMNAAKNDVNVNSTLSLTKDTKNNVNAIKY